MHEARRGGDTARWITALRDRVTHGAVSRQVALLESWFGRALFHRSFSQLTLTDAGRSYLAEVTPILDRLAIASLYLIEESAPTALRINAPPTFTMRWLITRMAGFQRRRADVEMQLTTSLGPVNFNEYDYDLAIRVSQVALEGCCSVPFMTEIIVPVCHVDLLKPGTLMQTQDLQSQTLISYATEPYSWPEWQAAADCPEIRPSSTLKFEQMYFGLHAAQEGLGIVLVPLFLAIDDILAGRLCLPFGLKAARRRKYYANFVATSDAFPIAKTFVDWLQREGRDTEQSINEWLGTMGWDGGDSSRLN